ncbi:hypothetical protein IC620_13105 [Hazenella sp. IB182357]|uniref:Uncharacterized protein n=1 Tax=Polycladospora coralii TaxID=2771432 RepID=A0A926NBP3_9BACL|nr:hypothetical protein [Polycladospora coralii]MBD1373287.1 hypothetical protein [Polycladospora coralii]MBS7528902.1 hypothetical protein [Polycladospora coralii]
MHTNYKRWMKHPGIDYETLTELKNLKNEEEISDRFDQTLSFGTAGVRVPAASISIPSVR